MSKADVSVNIVCYLKAVASGQVVTAICSIGDENVTFVYHAPSAALGDAQASLAPHSLARGFTYPDGYRETEPFADMLENEGARLTRVGVETKAYIQRKDDSDEETDEPANGGSTNSGDNNGGGVTPPGGNTGNDD